MTLTLINYLRKTLSVVKKSLRGPRPVLIKDCPKKWTDKEFKENDIFMEKIVGFASNYLQKGVSHWTSTD